MQKVQSDDKPDEVFPTDVPQKIAKVSKGSKKAARLEQDAKARRSLQTKTENMVHEEYERGSVNVFMILTMFYEYCIFRYF